MAECSANFDLGTLTATISTGDTGDATAWDAVTLGGVGTAIYDNTHVVASKAAKLATGGGGAIGEALTWSTALSGPLTDYYWRVYLYMEDLPAAGGNFHVIRSRNSTDYCWLVKISTAGVIAIENAAFSTIATFSTAMPTDQWVRFEGHAVHTGGSSGDVEVKLFLTASSTTPDETESVSATTIRANMTSVNFGVGSLNTTAWYDALIMGATSYPGPVAAPAQTLLASADSVDGSWTNESGGTTLAGSIDETTASDSDYIQSELAPSASGCRVKLAAGGDPASSSGHEINWRAGKNTTGGQTVNLTVKLYQGGGNSLGGGTLIADFDRNGVDAMTTYTETLSGGEADAITDYTDLYLEFHATAT